MRHEGRVESLKLRDSRFMKDLEFMINFIWLAIKTAITFVVPVMLGWSCISIFQMLGIMFEGTIMPYFLIVAFWITAVLGSVSLGALLAWALWGINPFRGVETKRDQRVYDAKIYIDMVRKRRKVEKRRTKQ